MHVPLSSVQNFLVKRRLGKNPHLQICPGIQQLKEKPLKWSGSPMHLLWSPMRASEFLIS